MRTAKIGPDLRLIFLYISLHNVIPSCTFYGGKVVYVPTFHVGFFSLPLILTLVAASISHFLVAALNFSCFFFQ